MSGELANFLFELVNFGLLAVGLGWFLFKPVRGAVDAEKRRRDETEKLLTTRIEALEQQEEALKAKRDRFAQELESERRDAIAAAQAEAQAIVVAAKADADKQRQVQSLAWKQERSELLSSLADPLGLVAAESVRRLLESLNGPQLDLALISAAGAELDSLPSAPRGNVIVESARPLSEAAREQLSRHLPEGFELRTNALLGAGVRVTTPQGLVDASGQALARMACEQVVAAVATGEESGDTSA